MHCQVRTVHFAHLNMLYLFSKHLTSKNSNCTFTCIYGTKQIISMSLNFLQWQHLGQQNVRVPDHVIVLLLSILEWHWISLSSPEGWGWWGHEKIKFLKKSKGFTKFSQSLVQAKEVAALMEFGVPQEATHKVFCVSLFWFFSSH